MPAADLIFLYGESVPICTHHIDKHYSGYCTLQYMAGGAVELGLGPKKYLLEGQWFWSAYPGPRMRFHPAAGHASWVHRYIAFQGPLLKRWEREGLFPVPPRQPPRNADFGPRFDQLLRYSRRTDQAGVRRAIHLLEGILLELADLQGDGEPSAPWVERARETLTRSAMSASVDYSRLADELGISQSTFRRQFRRATGASPHAFVLQQKAVEARRLLGETDLPIKSIAGQLGYRDVYFFSRQFRQLTGVPPATYRRSRQG
jgi:AraC-like DNA-binding protein